MNRIRLRLSFVVLGLALSACGGPAVGGVLSGGATDEASWGSALAMTRGSVLRVSNLTCLGKASGTGFVYDDHTIITNKHVVENARSLSLETQGGEKLKVSIAEMSSIDDIALIRSDDRLPRPVPLARRDPTPGDLVRALGYPLGGSFRATEGRVLEFVDGARFEHQEELILSSAAIEPGNSGGPLVDAEGRVVGVVFAIDLEKGATMAIPVSRLRDVIETRSFEQVATSCG